MGKRRDRKGRILRNGESQRTDGRYAYVYTDCFGKQKFAYSWKLEPTDPLPAGKKPCISLREKEKEIKREIDSGIMPYGGNLTVLELVNRYLKQKTGVDIIHRQIINLLSISSKKKNSGRCALTR